MPIEYRWNVIKFLQDTIVAKVPSGTPSGSNPAQIPSAYTGVVAPDYITLLRQLYLDEVGPISDTHGADLYQTFCLECHGMDGQGNGPGTTSHGIPSPSPFPTNVPEQYLYWRISEGVPDTFMYPFKTIFSLGDIWDIVSFMTSQGWGQTSGMPGSALYSQGGE
jgi:hypothetical protein